ncbi:hypothetical protein HFD88_007286 [Aspergillus terreus]|nr:hypothetical protein HFD88_007286 [Aspergillus terreus]
MTAEGVFVDVVGLSYRYGNTKGTTSEDFIYKYDPGAKVTFSIGDLVLGHCEGRATTTISNLVPDASIYDHRTVNRARLLFSLSTGQGFEVPIRINTHVEAVINQHKDDINLDSENLSDLDRPLNRICGILNLRPKSVYHTRNHLRREAAGFKVLRDLQIASPDGGYVAADIYLPLQLKGRFPVLVSCTLYGRRVPWGGPDLNDDEDVLAFERAEDEWHSTEAGTELHLPDRGPWSEYFRTQRGFENLATFNTFSYVPKGYAMVRMEPKGVSETPGNRWEPGQLAGDFYTVCEWCADQPWSNGNVALVGSSYGANTQWAVAGLKPKGLKCFVPYGTDLDSYRDAAYIGGVPATRYLENWFARVRGVSPKWQDHLDVESLMKSNPTYNHLWAMMESKPETTVDIPCFLGASQIFMIHGRGAYEAWMARRPDNTHLQLIDSDYYSWPNREAAGKILEFLNHHLKTEGCFAPERVGIQMRLGNQKWYWRKEANWPVPGTEYIKWHLHPDGTLATTPPASGTPEKRISYPARTASAGDAGFSFQSSPMEEDVEMAGHFAATLCISSTAPDADVVVLVWAIDEHDNAVAYGASHTEPEPLAKGFLRVSHRKTDPERSLPWRPWHTHLESDLMPLQGPEDVVEITVEILPAAARLRKGWSLRVDVCPSEDQPNIPGYEAPSMRLWYGETQSQGVLDTLHVGGGRANFLMCPVVPRSEDYPRCIT